jgi:hypothetical protein
MASTRNGRLMTLALMAIGLAMGAVLLCEQLHPVPIIPLHNGQVQLRNGAVVITAPHHSESISNDRF